ncbi:MAG TPA: hypothetical protein VJN89_13265 [Candidatus Acidoferrum sp.]|nr:hypothetical protein [Candidatus Acidoferrum sp.]
MKIKKSQFLFVALAILLFAGASVGQQQRIFDWVAANDETVRLDPANYHSGPIYHPGPDGGNNHVDIKSQLPVTIFMTPEETWQQALQHPETIANLPQTCPREHVVETTYVCHVPPQAMRLVIRDERYSPENAVFAGLGEVMEPIKNAGAVGYGIAAVLNAERRVEQTSTRRFKDPNDLHIQYYNWNCVQYCVQPEFRWMEQVKEQYKLTPFLKVYGGFQPDHDGEQVSIKIKSPVPMVVAMVPSQTADQFYSQPGALEGALQKNACQQRAVQSLEFQCTFSLADGPQSLVVAPEAGERVPHKKAEVLMLAWRCVENCQLLQTAKQ